MVCRNCNRSRQRQCFKVGDKVVSRLSIRADRAMDFVQLKDQRGACFEPIGSVSGYRWNNGIGYYVDIKDAATNFFFDHLGKGGMYLNIVIVSVAQELTKRDRQRCSVPMHRNMLHIPLR